MSQNNTRKVTLKQNHKWRGIIEPAKHFVKAFDAQREIIAVDLDEVLRDHIQAIIDATLLRYGVHLSREQFDVWDPPLGELCGVSNQEWTAWAWSDSQIFADSLPVEGAAIGMAWLMRRYEVRIVTSTRWPQLTDAWLTRWQIPYHKVIYTQDKAGEKWDYLIDDRPSTLQALHESGRRVIRFALPWNECLSYLPALADWSQVRRVFGRESDAMFWPGMVIPRSAWGLR